MSACVGAFRTSVVREGGGPSALVDEDADVANVASLGRVVTSNLRDSLSSALRHCRLDVEEKINGLMDKSRALASVVDIVDIVV